jgi:hypothetical protein
MFACYHITGIASPWLILSRETWFIYVAAAKLGRGYVAKKLTMTLLKLIFLNFRRHNLAPFLQQLQVQVLSG